MRSFMKIIITQIHCQQLLIQKTREDLIYLYRSHIIDSWDNAFHKIFIELVKRYDFTTSTPIFEYYKTICWCYIKSNLKTSCSRIINLLNSIIFNSFKYLLIISALIYYLPIYFLQMSINLYIGKLVAMS